MRGFLQVKAKAEGMGAATYANFVTAGKRTDTRTEDARRWFKIPAYCVGERRKKYEEAIRRESRDIQGGD